MAFLKLLTTFWPPKPQNDPRVSRDCLFSAYIIIIIIMAGMAVVWRGWLPHRGEAQMAYNYCFPTRTMFQINSEFWRKGIFRWENLTSLLVRTKNSSYYIAPVGDRTHDLPHTVASNMFKVSHALNHSATEAVMSIPIWICRRVPNLVTIGPTVW